MSPSPLRGEEGTVLLELAALAHAVHILAPITTGDDPRR
jgi:hypothetical protein